VRRRRGRGRGGGGDGGVLLLACSCPLVPLRDVLRARHLADDRQLVAADGGLLRGEEGSQVAANSRCEYGWDKELVRIMVWSLSVSQISSGAMQLQISLQTCRLPQVPFPSLTSFIHSCASVGGMSVPPGRRRPGCNAHPSVGGREFVLFTRHSDHRAWAPRHVSASF